MHTQFNDVIHNSKITTALSFLNKFISSFDFMVRIVNKKLLMHIDFNTRTKKLHASFSEMNTIKTIIRATNRSELQIES